ncbi:MAG: GNAT family N-acetyltransferase [Candidatus Izemoplasma sp.]
MDSTQIYKLTNIPLIDLDDIYLRAIKYEDYHDMFEYGSDDRVTNSLTWNYKTLEEAEKLIEPVFLSRPSKGLPKAYAIVCKHNDKMIGTCDFHSVNWATNQGEIGYALNYDYWGKGYVTKACIALVDFGFNNLELTKIVISHQIGNIGSKRVIEKSGFKFIEEAIHPKSKELNKFYEITKEDYFTNK